MPSLVSQPLRRYCRFVGESHARRHRCVGVPSRRFYSSNRPAERYEPTVLLDDICFGEGPRWRNGRLYFSDFYAATTLKEGPDGKMHLVGGGEVRSVTLDGQSEVVAKVPGRPSGLGFVDQKDFCREETLLCVSMTDRRLVAIDLLDGTLSLIANLAKHTGGPCNDCVVCPASGRTWVGNFGWDLFGGEDQNATRLVLVDLDGSDPRPTGGDVLFPNGGVLANDGETLVVAESFAKRLTAFDVCAVTGELTNQRVWAELPHIPDGIAMDHEGCIWVACPTFDPKDRIGSGRNGGYIRVAEGGQVKHRLELTGGRGGYACAFGGEDGNIFFGLDAKETDPFVRGTLARGNSRLTITESYVRGAPH